MGADDRQKGVAVAGGSDHTVAVDRLSAARRLAWVSAVLTLVALASLLGDAGWRPRPQLELAAQVMAGLDLDVPAWVPAGRAGRHATAWRAAVDLRASPSMFRWDPSVDRLLIQPPVAPPHGEVGR